LSTNRYLSDMKGLPVKAATLLGLSLSLTLAISACSKNDAPTAPAAPTAAAAPAVTANSLETVAAKAKGFTVGAMMSAQTTYVFFDPQCPHCARLWQASLPLHNTMKFVWVPIAFNPAKSVAQGAALLSAANPLETMNAHETALLAGQGGMSASSQVPDDLAQAIKANTDLLGSLGAEAVPFLIGQNRQTQAMVTHTGAMETAALAQLLGLN
jgi:thiol:disulfide interchange protein DsbG